MPSLIITKPTGTVPAYTARNHGMASGVAAASTSDSATPSTYPDCMSVTVSPSTAARFAGVTSRSITPTDLAPPISRSSSEAVGLQQPKPDLADRGEGRYGVPELLERDLTDDGDRRGVDELGRVLPDERHADDDPPALVDDHPSLAGIGV